MDEDQFINKIICGDCMEVMRQMPDSCIDLVVTSPPYNIREGAGRIGRQSANKKSGLITGKIHDLYREGFDGYADNLSHADYVAWMRNTLTEMMRLLKETGAIFWNHHWPIRKGILKQRYDILDGFPVRQIIIWHRGGGIAFHDTFFLPTYQVIYLIAKRKFKLVKGASSKYKDVWKISQEYNNPHPAPFPLELAKRCILSTDANIIFDPFLGSGTTAYAAKILGRNFIGIEQSQKYCKMAEERLQTAHLATLS